ncbi:hypothetical protein [Calidithermus chliarophilus]|uniref:hypothetical protein n=1 Tax=Calidithermus chliarophilus TaxID=52023 RepID=UPI0003F65C8F|nr:hypothetical protein [Calidithermus chliarophilus]
MKLLQTLKAQAARVSERLSDVPARAAAAAPVAPAVVPPVVAMEPWRPFLIDFKDFQAAQAFTPGEFFKAAEFEVPTETLLRLEAGRIVRAYLYAQYTEAGANGGADADATINVPVIQTPHPKPALNTEASKYHPEVRVWCKVGGVWRRACIKAINYGVSVTYVEPAGTTDVEAYYVHGDGEMRLRAYRRLGASDTAAVTLFNSSVSALHTVNQTDGEAAMRWPQENVLSDDFTIGLEIKSSLTHVVNERSPFILRLPAYLQEVRTLDPVRKAQLAELDVRGGL